MDEIRKLIEAVKETNAESLCAINWLRDALDCKDFVWDGDQWNAADECVKATQQTINALRTAIPAAEAELAGMGEGEELGMMVRMALPFARAYALRNPKHNYHGRVQDPCGVHEWLDRYDRMVAPPQPKEDGL